jgi:hypothetical protein
MNINKSNYARLAAGFAVAALWVGDLHAQVTVLPSSFALPVSTANTNQPGFIFNISEVANSEPNQLAWAELQLAGLEGDNLADPTAAGVAAGPAQAPSPSTAPISFLIPTVINLSKNTTDNKGDFTPDNQMPGLPGTTSSTDNAAAEILTYLQLAAGTNTMAVNSDDGFRLTLGGTDPHDRFALNVGQFDGGRGAADTVFQIVVTQPGLYPARLLWENGGGDANVEWFTILDSPGGTNRVLVNDLANKGVPAYRSVTTPARAYATKVDPAPSATGVVANEGIHVALLDGSTPIAQSSISLVLDGAVVTPTISRTGTVTSVDYTPAAPWPSTSQHTVSFVYADGTLNVTNTWSFAVQYYVALDPNWRVTGVDTNKPGFNWNIFANSDAGRLNPNNGNSNERAERDLTLQAVDANGAVLPNLASPSVVGAAIGAAVAPTAPNAPIHFEIATTLILDNANNNMPGSPSTDNSTDGQAAEVLTYVTLPVGVVAMQVESDNGWRLYSGVNPADSFGRAVIAEHNDGTGAVQFSFTVTQAGTYPFRLVWENGKGSPHLNWYSFDTTGKPVPVNDVTHGGVPAYRALVAGTTVQPYITGVAPIPAIHQMEVANTNLTIILTDGTHLADDASVSLTVDGKSINPVKQRQGGILTISDGGAAFPSLQLPSDVHTALLTYKDSTGAYSRTQQWSFNNIQSLVLPANPVVQENFDSYPEATSTANTVPPGWTAWNYTAENTAGWDLTDKSSDSYKNWIIISTTTATSIEGASLDNDPNQTINGQPVANFASGNVLWATSDGRSGVQAQFCTSKPFDLSSITNPVLIYSSLMRASGAANAQADGIEYSVDGGNTWLPGIIYVGIANNTEGVVKLAPDGSIDAVRTLNTPYSVLDWVDPATGKAGGGSHGSGLAEPVTPALAPYIAIRSNVTGTSTKVDGIRLPQASKQKSVTLRFFQVGNCSWWWGVDNLAFYDLAPTVVTSIPTTAPRIDSIQVAGGNVTIKWSKGGTLESTPTLSNPTWTTTGNNSGTFSESASTSGNKFYRVRD